MTPAALPQRVSVAFKFAGAGTGGSLAIRAAIVNCGDGWRKSEPAQKRVSAVKAGPHRTAGSPTCYAVRWGRESHPVPAAVSAGRVSSGGAR